MALDGAEDRGAAFRLSVAVFDDFGRASDGG